MNLIDMFGHADDAERFSAGSWLFHEGAPGSTMYVLLEGEVEISVRGRVLLLARAGDVLGEMALIDSKSRSASAQARTDCRAAPVNEARFLDMVRQTPAFSLHVMRVLADRLRGMDKRI